MLDLIVSDKLSTLPLKEFLRKSGLSLTLRRRIKHNGVITRNGTPISWNEPVFGQDQITVSWPLENKIEPMPLPLAIAYEDSALLVIDKPPDIMVHPTARQDSITIANGVLHHYRESGQSCDFHPVHRLDRQTSGLLLLAKNAYIHHLLSGQGIKHVQRTYQAIVTGQPQPAAGTINAPIGRKPGSIIERMISPCGQEAVTDYQMISGVSAASLMQISLRTGRTHQIRVHFSHIGHPLLGDDLYGGATELINRQALHAGKLAFNHPITNELLTIHSPLPADMRSVLTLLGMHDPFDNGL
ncbi:RluA family pseudouridine synthase [Anaerospora hongkongensis]|uniref:RluA family pseudouridine synthase n=1 Tax=Anaerospora hongkongensis TaxID=244830 RepID=UPI00289747C7|nr:RluA family pseudouridine synthase [Anaerospora hongkongensis]